MSALLNQGGFGCVYYPGINCSGNLSKSKNIITKLQRQDFSSKNEFKIGKIITTIKNYQQFFSPATGMCKVNLAKISKKILGKCEVIRDDTDNVVLMDFPYIKNTEFIKILSLNKKNLITELFSMYTILLDAIELLNRKNIVHFDLKLENILFESITNVPIIIDFGISLYIPEINFENAHEYFYTYSPDYYVWPIEVHVLSFLLNETNMTLTELDIKKISNQYVSNNTILHSFSDQFRERYENMCNEILIQYVGMKRELVFEKIISYHNTWDAYSLAIIINIIIKLIESAINNKEYIRPTDMLLRFIESTLLSISPDPQKRPSINESRDKFSKIFYNDENIENYIEIINIMNIDKHTIKKLRDDMNHLYTLKLKNKTKK